MKYLIKVNGMNCPGCAYLVEKSLTEQGYDNIEVQLEESCALFESNKSKEEIEKIIKEEFAKLPHHVLESIEVKK